MKILGLNIRLSPKVRVPQIKFHVPKRVTSAGNRVAKAFRQAVTRGRETVAGKSVYEVRRAEDGWMIAEKGSGAPLRVFVKKQEAIREARRMARQHRTELDIFGRDGELQNHYSFST